MDLFASLMMLLASLLWGTALLHGWLLGVRLFQNSALPVMKRLHIFGLYVFGVHGVIVTFYFLISLLPVSADCYDLMVCETTAVVKEISAQRWGYGAGALVAFTIAFFHFKNIDFSDKPNHEASK